MTSSVSSGFGDLLHAGDKIREEAHGELPFLGVPLIRLGCEWNAPGLLMVIRTKASEAQRTGGRLVKTDTGIGHK